MKSAANATSIQNIRGVQYNVLFHAEGTRVLVLYILIHTAKASNTTRKVESVDDASLYTLFLKNERIEVNDRDID